MEILEKFCQTRYGEICYLEIGSGSRNLLVLHGGLGTPELINGLTPYLLTLNYKIVAPFLPGHGKSFKIQSNFHFDDMVNSVDELINKLGIKKADVLGHSLGGGLGAKIASKRFTDKIILIDPILDSKQLNLLYGAWGVINDTFSEKAFLSSVMPTLEGIRMPSPHYLQSLEILRIIKETKVSNVSKQNKDVLVCWGKDDKMVPFLKHKDILDKLGWKNISLFPGSHYWYKHRQRMLFEAIQEFVLK